jgi:5-methylcytosine-specific restriction endonuclease McrA
VQTVPAIDRHRNIVRTEKLTRGACCDCGLVIDERTIVCIDFDHRNPVDKSFTISQKMGRVKDQELIAEMAKCDAVCRNCHAIRTHEGQHHLFRRTPSATLPNLFD